MNDLAIGTAVLVFIIVLCAFFAFSVYVRITHTWEAGESDYNDD